MLKKMSWIIGMVIIAAMLLASCGKSQTPATQTSPAPATTTAAKTTAPPTTQTPGKTPTVAVPVIPKETQTPVYGGSLTFAAARAFTTWDPAGAPVYMQPYLSMFDPVVGADATKTPSGNGEWNYLTSYIPQQYVVGRLAESFEQPDVNTVIWHIRKGVNFQNKPPANGREIVASDFVYCINRIQADVRSSWYKPNAKDLIVATALDKYTVQLKLGTPSVEGFRTTVQVYPQEVVTTYGNLEDWKNLNGTGPWILTDCVADSSLTYVKNPVYWRFDENRSKNRLPYLDGYRYIIIPDTQTSLAALRTHKIDLYTVQLNDAQNLMKSNPELKYITRGQEANNMIDMRNDIAPFNNIKVRKALAMALDRQAFVDYYGGYADILEWPFFDNMADVYTPLDQLPADVKENFVYNPTKAKQLLAEAGFPNGFSLELVTITNNAQAPDQAALVKSYWDAIGVKTTINAADSNIVMPTLWVCSYKNTALDLSWGNTSPWSVNTGAYRGKVKYATRWNYSNINDDYYDQWTDKLLIMVDPATRNQGLKEQGVYSLQQAWNIQLPRPRNFTFFQPYVLGYHGEIGGTLERSWIDPALKAKYK